MIGEIQRLKGQGLSRRKVARALGISRNTVAQYWDPPKTGEAGAAGATAAKAKYEAPWAGSVDWEACQRAVNAGEALTVWLEDRQRECGAEDPLKRVAYPSFWREYKRRYPRVPLEFHKTHPPGERAEFDYKGRRPGFGYHDYEGGRFVQCEMFGVVLCFSQKLYVEAARSQKKADFLGSLQRGLEDFGGVPAAVTGDNLRSAVMRADRYDPELNPDFAAFCAHYGTAPCPARPRKPKDKNLIEGALGLFWRWIRVKLAQRRFYSLANLNAWLRQMLDTFNARVQRKYGISRQEKFESAERALLKPLPQTPYEISEWKVAKVHWDCFVQVDTNFYSAPFALRGEALDVRITQERVELYRNLERVAVHRRMTGKARGRYVRDDLHMPPAHKAMLEMVPQSCLEEAARIGPETHALIERLLAKAPHPLWYLRRAQGILSLKRHYSAQSLERSCAKLNTLSDPFPPLRTVKDIIKAQALPGALPDETPAARRQPNPNLRGQAHWQDLIEQRYPV